MTVAGKPKATGIARTFDQHWSFGVSQTQVSRIVREERWAA